MSRAGDSQPTVRPPHILTIAEVDGGLRYSIECPGVTNACRAWVDCPKFGKECDDDLLDEDNVAHGVEHQWIDGDWMIPTEECLVAVHDHLDDALDTYSPVPGRYPVDHDFGDGSELYLTIRDRPEPAVA